MGALDWIGSVAGTVFTWINANSGGIGILATIVSLLGAAVSTVSARRSAKMADGFAFQTLVRDVAVAAKGVTMQLAELETLELNLAQSYVSLGVFSGGTGSSRLEMFKQNAANKVAHAKAISHEAFAVVSDPMTLKTLKSEELAERKLRLDMVDVELGGMRKIMSSEFQQVNDQVKMYQQKVIGSTPRH
jgi:hypothetical protein